MHKRMMRYGGALMFAGALALAGCGDDGKDGQDGQDLTAVAKPESCAVCHAGAGSSHQAIYDRYTDASTLGLTIEGVSSSANGDGTFTSTMTVAVTRNGQPYVDEALAGLEQKRFYAFDYRSATGEFVKAVNFNGVPAHQGGGRYTVTNANASFAPETVDAQAYAYVADAALPTEGMTLYDDVASASMKFSAAVDGYQSAANVEGCEKCHGAPYLKHGYRAARVDGLPDFVACKACHLDQTNGSHQDWQLLVDDPAAYAAAQARVPSGLTAEEKAKYAYKRTVMNDVHMSHAMEFAYPQSMANCVTCHEGKLDAVLTDANFTLATCKSCHPVTGVGVDPEKSKRAPALASVLPAGAQHENLYAYTGECNSCHAGAFKPFSAIHPGYDTRIFAAEGLKYSEAFKVTIDEASLAGNVLTVKFHAAESPDVAGLAVTDITPTVMIGLYGYDTKDFIVSAHGRDANDKRNLEWVWNEAHPRFKAISAANGVWELTADLSGWADKLADGTIKRAEIAVMPALKNAAGQTLALDAPSRTFDLGGNAFEDDRFAPIVDVAKCNVCHEALATTFHSGNRGGNVVVCRVCHTTLDGGSHLEMQSRSIDSYVHAVHSMQPFDTDEVDFADPVAALLYEHHVESTYPNFTILNCESCHNPGTYDVPDQSRSLPGLLSASYAVTKDRAIGAVPSYVTGPASRACGSCHRTEMINEDKAGELAAFNEHTSTFGYLLENGEGVLDAAIARIMAMFK